MRKLPLLQIIIYLFAFIPNAFAFNVTDRVHVSLFPDSYGTVIEVKRLKFEKIF